MWCYFCLLRARGVRSASRLVVSLIRLPRCYYYTTCKWCMESHLSSDAGVLLALVPWPPCAVRAACVAAGCVREPGLAVRPASWPACASVAWCCGAVLCPAPWCVGLLCLPCGLSIVWGSRIAVACSAVSFIAAIRVYYAPTSPCSGCSLSWCSHLPPSRHCFTWAHATSPNYDGWPQAPVIRRADLLHRLRQTRQFLLRCHASSCFLFSCVFMPALLLWLYRQWLSVLPFRP